jgi:hypothetical protein
MRYGALLATVLDMETVLPLDSPIRLLFYLPRPIDFLVLGICHCLFMANAGQALTLSHALGAPRIGYLVTTSG